MTLNQQEETKWHVDKYPSEEQAKYVEEYFQKFGLIALRFGKVVYTAPSSFSLEGFTPADFFYCEDCKMWVDYWKYDSLKETSCEGHRIRNPKNLDELKQCIESCSEEEEYCEDCLDYVVPTLRKKHEGHTIVKRSCVNEEYFAMPTKHEPLVDAYHSHDTTTMQEEATV